jgi:hypothetical protein
MKQARGTLDGPMRRGIRRLGKKKKGTWDIASSYMLVVGEGKKKVKLGVCGKLFCLRGRRKSGHLTLVGCGM